MIIGDIVTGNERLFPDKMGIIDEHHRLTWREVNHRVNRLANALLGFGLTKGDRAAIICENCHQYAEFLFAVAKAGLMGVSLNYRLTTSKLSYMINDSEPRVIFAQDKFVPTIRQSLANTKREPEVITIGEGDSYESLLAASPSDEPEVEVNEPDTYLLQYTTGTTGTPKGIELTHRNWIYNCLIRFFLTRLAEDEVFLVNTPLFAAAGPGHFLAACFAGVTVVLHVFSARSFVEMIDREKVTFSYLLPSTFRIVRDYLESSERKYDLSSLRKLSVGGGQYCSAQQLKEMLDYFHIPYANSGNKGWGSSEFATNGTYFLSSDMVAGLRPDASEAERKRLDSVGRPLLNTEIRVVDENDKDVPPGQKGEIRLRSDGVMKGYWKQPELTQKALRGGWYHTGDMGILDEDGYLYFAGRKDFLLKSGGFFVAPEEVENCILQHPSVAEVAVIGIPDAKWGQLVTAIIRLKPGMAATEQEIKDRCRQDLAGFQVPKLVDFVEELPRESAYGKISREKLVEIYSKDSQA